MMTTYTFTVDAALLRELGERLVGRPYMALAELIKNSYDADATSVVISFEGDSISLADNGHGMSENDFEKRWMRVGTTNKVRAGVSPRLHRPLTGSKGVGRLSVQVLGSTTRVVSRGLLDNRRNHSLLMDPIDAFVDWDAAIRKGDLTAVTVNVRRPEHDPIFPGDSTHGTIVTISGLTQEWSEADFTNLAREIWALRPPFEDESKAGMSISLQTGDTSIDESFSDQMKAVLEIWTARITGRLVDRSPSVNLDGTLPARLDGETDPIPSNVKRRRDRVLKIDVEVRGSSRRTVYYLVPNSAIDRVRFDIRVFSLNNRQPLGVAVGEARAYLRRYGGVNIFDAGFRLPYYGPEQDWLNSERDHARRLDRSRLVPEALQVKRGLQDLPSNARLYGLVRVSTSHEAEVGRRVGDEGESLTIQVSRDRLTDNLAYQQLRVIVRAGLDLYAMETARAKLVEASRLRAAGTQKASDALGALAETVERARGEIASPVYDELRDSVRNAITVTRAAEQSSAAYASLLGALATAGSTSLAYEHEISKQVASLAGLADQLISLADGMPPEEARRVREVVGRMHEWRDRVAGIRAVFGPLLSKESRDTVVRYNTRSTVRKVSREIAPLAQGIRVDDSAVPSDLFFPPATLPAWTSILQNLFVNAYNALAETEDPRILVTGRRGRLNSQITVMDNGVGVDVEKSEQLWDPFHRELLLSPEKEAAGLGGMGLGLTIVRMICDDVGVEAAFVEPAAPFTTAVRLKWKEPQA